MNYDAIDFNFSDDGDLVIDAKGDIASTVNDQILPLKQQIISILKTTQGDWESSPTLGANLWKFIGEPNSRENAKRMEETIRNALVAEGLVSERDLTVKVNAISLHAVAIDISVNADPTAFNSLIDFLEMTVFFDSSDGQLMWSLGPEGDLL